jgi:hypothetical protein
VTEHMRRGRMGLLTALIAVVVAGGAAIASTSRQANLGAKKVSVLSGHGDEGEDIMALHRTGVEYPDVPGVSTTISIPSGQTGLIIARFASTTKCNFGAAGTRCELGLVVVKPGGVVDRIGFAAIDTDDEGDNYSEAHAFEASGGPYPAGTYKVKLIYRILGGNTQLILSGWHLTVELWRVS